MPTAKSRARKRATSPVSTSSLSSLDESPSPPPPPPKKTTSANSRARKASPIKEISKAIRSYNASNVQSVPTSSVVRPHGFPNFSSSLPTFISSPTVPYRDRATTSSTRLNATASSSSINASSSQTLVGSPEEVKVMENSGSQTKKRNGKVQVDEERTVPPKRSRLNGKGKQKESDDEELSSKSDGDDDTPRKSQRRAASSTFTDVTSSPRQRQTSLPIPELSDFESDEENGQTLDAFLEILDQPENGPSTKKEERPFRPTPMPEGISIGDYVYVKNRNNWWIGRVVRYDPADNLEDQKKGRNYYTVLDRFGEELKKRKVDEIITKNDDRIATCVRGSFETTKKDFHNDAATRDPTPPPEGDVDQPVTSDEFVDLDRVDQLRLIRPRLLRIVSETYPPAQWRVEMFFGGRSERQKLASQSKYGDISEDEVAQVIIPELKRWVMRRLRWHGQRDEHTRPEEPPRPTGSERYNELERSGLEDYIHNVLVPEAIIQLCIRSYPPDMLLSGQALDEDDEEDGLGDTIVHDDDVNQSASAEPSTANSATTTPTAPHLNEDEIVPAEETLYKAADKLITALYKKNEAKIWATEEAFLRRARERKRKEQGLPDENMNEYELAKWKEDQLGMYKGWASSRMRYGSRFEDNMAPVRKGKKSGGGGSSRR
ncbi:hypothetical protein CI109_105644 [Kwoniella shandongensis]|uniref:Uncharacterized protein n=1 Tax=Kwoniella shandongensis TaxID=1734106 RepID=A0A5M6C7M8_9TREE|nr:uncharacterized protein CI109_002360 [Kwoniella shandongensis]KAA5529465.1 hypothetical protein CI109_002360 [Kwoniella shandongensis]